MDPELRAKGEQIVGKVKEEVGKATGDRRTEWTGKKEQIVGKVKEEVSKASVRGPMPK